MVYASTMGYVSTRITSSVVKKNGAIDIWLRTILGLGRKGMIAVVRVLAIVE